MIGSRQSTVDFWRVFGREKWEHWPTDVLGPVGGRIWLSMYRIAASLMDISFLLMRMHTQMDNLLDGTDYAIPSYGNLDEEAS
jgi:hypothetical protein